MRTYYQITMFESKADLPGCLPYKGYSCVFRRLFYRGDDDNIPFDLEVESESLAIKILLVNQFERKYALVSSWIPEEDLHRDRLICKKGKELERLLLGGFAKVFVKKYRA